MKKIEEQNVSIENIETKLSDIEHNTESGNAEEDEINQETFEESEIIHDEVIEQDIEFVESDKMEPGQEEGNFITADDTNYIVQVRNPEEEEVLDETKVEQVQTQCFSCASCERSFPLQQLLDIHMRQHTRERKFNCNECGKKFFSKHDLAKHVQTHTGDKPYSCVICDKSFSRATPLHRHEKIHISVPKYLCTYCDKTYLNSDDLDAHMRVHKKIRPFQCTQCDKKFAFKQGLERHEMSHNTANLHKCNYCSESFSTPSKLRRHITCHAGARPYPCKLCPRTFLLSHHLTRHLRNHYNQRNRNEEGGEYKCDVCSMSFKKKLSLVNHSAIHSMVNLKCVICNKEFEDAQTVREHITTHLTDLPYICYKCEYTFENETDLLEHEQKHTDDYDSETDAQETPIAEENVEVSSIEQSGQIRRSTREKKTKSFADFLQAGEFSDTDENTVDPEEDVITPSAKTTTTSIQPVIRSEAIKVYKGIKDKLNIKSTSTSSKVDPSQKTEPGKESKKTLTKITTLENLGLSKNALDSMTDKSGFVEMKIGQKVIRVQKLMMTKSEVQAMAKEGRIEMKGTKVVMKDAAGGILDINKITSLGKATGIQDELIIDPNMTASISPAKGIRTYVKKLKRGEAHVDTIEILDDNVCKDFETTETIDIDLKNVVNEEDSTSIDESETIILV